MSNSKKERLHFDNNIACGLEESKAALSEPLRNCDVGTVEEQIKRFYNEYYSKKSKCKRRWSFGECAIDWSQMPYGSEVK